MLMLNQKDVIAAALRIAKERKAACRSMIPCPECHTKQVQIMSWDEGTANWRCRHCRATWETTYNADE